MEKKLTLLFHAHDTIMTHSLPQTVTNHIKFLDERHDQKDPLTVTRGKVHDYLGMTVDVRNRGSVVLSQHYDIKKFFVVSLIICVQHVETPQPLRVSSKWM